MVGGRVLTKDGHQVGVGDQVWTENHLPWVITGFFDRTGYPWVSLAAAHQEADLDSESELAVEDVGRLVYRFHPRGDCAWAGCRYRPWGERR